jgi:hypothetical protein
VSVRLAEIDDDGGVDAVSITVPAGEKEETA